MPVGWIPLKILIAGAMLVRIRPYDGAMPIELHAEELESTLERAYLIASSDKPLPQNWLARAQSLEECPSNAAIAAYGAVLLARATNPNIDPFAVQAQDGGAGAFSLRSAAGVLARNRRSLGFDIGSRSDRDPINAKTWISARQWNDVLKGVRASHRPWIQIIIKWLPDIAKLDADDALLALAAYIRARPAQVGADLGDVEISEALTLSELAGAIDAFLASHIDSGATGLAIVAASFRAAGFEAKIRTTTDPVRLDVRILHGGKLFIGSEVKQLPGEDATVQTLAEDVASAKGERGLLALLPPGNLGNISVRSSVQRAYDEFGAMIRVTNGTAELLAEAFACGREPLNDFIRTTPVQLVPALAESGATQESVDDWLAIANRWFVDDYAAVSRRSSNETSRASHNSCATANANAGGTAFPICRY